MSIKLKEMVECTPCEICRHLIGTGDIEGIDVFFKEKNCGKYTKRMTICEPCAAQLKDAINRHIC